MKISLPWGKSGNRSVADIVSGLTSMVSELEAKTASCCTGIETCETSKITETERHTAELSRILDVQTGLETERASAETVAANLRGVLGTSAPSEAPAE